jgi:2-phospho-L-lactate guanylyltransferase
MLDHVLSVLASVREVAGVLVVTVDAAAAALAERHGANVCGEGARDGHTGAVAAAARRLAAQGRDLLTVPGDLPLLEADDIRTLLAAHRAALRRHDLPGTAARAFSIVPARDARGSNAIACSPADAVPLRFGSDSFIPHLAAARACGIEPQVLPLARIGLDVDTPDDLERLMAVRPQGRIHALLRQWDLPARWATA